MGARLEMETRQGTTTLVRLRGELDIAGCDMLEQELSSAVDEGASTVDRGPQHASTSSTRAGCASCLQTDADMREKGVKLAIVRGAPAVHRVFEITRTEERLEFVDDASEVASDGAG